MRKICRKDVMRKICKNEVKQSSNMRRGRITGLLAFRMYHMDGVRMKSGHSLKEYDFLFTIKRHKFIENQVAAIGIEAFLKRKAQAYEMCLPIMEKILHEIGLYCRVGARYASIDGLCLTLVRTGDLDVDVWVHGPYFGRRVSLAMTIDGPKTIAEREEQELLDEIKVSTNKMESRL